MDKFRHIDTWVFDLDNTLYDAETHVFVEISRRMTQYVARHLDVPEEEASKIRRKYFETYGTTLRGLMTEHGIEPVAFMEEVHDVDLAPVPQCRTTIERLALLPGRKFVFTNSSEKFARRMTAHLGIDHHFDGIFAIEHADFLPKPDPAAFHAFLASHAVMPNAACMFEDMEINLKTAHDLGMTTVWLHGKNPQIDHPHVHHRAEKLSDWLTRTTGK